MTQVERAAIGWWRTRRPLDWSVEEHLETPAVNCVTYHEEKLAEAVAALIRKQYPERRAEGQ